MNQPIHILHLEDDATDAELAQATLEAAGLACQIRRVQTRAEFSAAVQQGGYDIILADFRLPMFDGMSALRMIQERGLDVPFIFVSGTMGEDAAIEGLTQGATDYVLKQKLSRLAPAVKRALREAENQRERRRVEKALRESEQKYKEIFDNVSDSLFVFDVTGDGRFRFTGINATAERIGGVSNASAYGKFLEDVVRPEQVAHALPYFRRCIETGEPLRYEEECSRPPIGRRYFDTTLLPVCNSTGSISRLIVVNRDITERKQTEEHVARSNRLKERLLGSAGFDQKAKMITDGAVELFDADFARLWITREGDLCDKGCRHAAVTEGPHVCRDRTRCLHLVASSGRYTHINGGHRRVPLGCYKIGRVATGDESRFVTNDVSNDPRVHDHEWTKSLGLVSFVGFRLLSADGKPVGVFALFRKHAITPDEETLMEDLANTASHVIVTGLAEEALAQERNLLRTLIDNTPDFVWIKDTESRFVVGNIAVAQSFGRIRPEEIYGKSDFDFHPPELAARYYADEQEIIRSGQPLINREEPVIEFGGQRIWLLSTKVPLRDSHGEIIGLVGISRNITEQVQAREALQQSATCLESMHEIDRATLTMQPVETIAETALTGLRRLVPCRQASVALFDPTTGDGSLLAIQADGAIRLAAGTRIPVEMLESAGLRQGQIRVVEDVLNLAHLPPVIQALQSEGVRSYVNVPLLAGDELFGMLNLAADRPAAFAAAQITIASQVADQLVIAVQQARLREQVQRHTAELEQRVAARTAELAETAARLQTANERLKELDQLKSQFVANVSHELRTPLANIKAYLYLLEHGKPEKHAQYMTTLHSETSHLEYLIEDLLDLSRLDQGKIRIRLAAVDVNRVIAMLLDARALLVRQAGLTLEVLPQPTLPPALADEDRLMQVLTNLLANATHYTPQGGTITLRTGLQQAEGRAWVTVAVSDTGLGITPQDLPHIFERFYRGTAAQQRNVPGTGLGLAICQEIMQRMDGRITVESQVGAGSTFAVWLPIV